MLDLFYKALTHYHADTLPFVVHLFYFVPHSHLPQCAAPELLVERETVQKNEAEAVKSGSKLMAESGSV